MFKFVVTFGLLSFSLAPTLAADLELNKAASAKKASITTTVDLASAYVSGGRTRNKKPVFQPSLEGSANGFRLGTWGSFATDKQANERFANEIDLYVTYDRPVGIVNLSATVTHAMYPGEEQKLADNQDLCLSAGLALPLNPTFKIGYGLDQQIRDSKSYELSVNEAVYQRGKLATNLGAKLGYSDPKNGVDGFSHLTLQSAVTYAKLSAAVNYVVETDRKVNDLSKQEKVYATIGTTQTM